MAAPVQAEARLKHCPHPISETRECFNACEFYVKDGDQSGKCFGNCQLKHMIGLAVLDGIQHRHPSPARMCEHKTAELNLMYIRGARRGPCPKPSEKLGPCKRCDLWTSDQYCWLKFEMLRALSAGIGGR